MLRLLDPWCIRPVPLRNLDNIWCKAVVSGNLNHPVLLSESDFIGGGQRVCISNKFQGGAHASAPGPHVESHCTCGCRRENQRREADSPRRPQASCPPLPGSAQEPVVSHFSPALPQHGPEPEDVHWGRPRGMGFGLEGKVSGRHRMRVLGVWGG